MATPVFYNVFTKSYKLRYIVHAAAKSEERTLCGRTIIQNSKTKFDESVTGACKKCVQRLEIKRRAHPGWVED